MKQWNSSSVENYYNRNQVFYDLFYSMGTGGIHYGFWDKNTRHMSDAIQNTNRCVAEYLEPSEDDRILDAGCGVGATGFYLARNSGAHVVGITLSERQIKVAQRKAVRLGLQDRITFHKQDYTHTDFPDGSFTRILALESVCYAKKKIDFLREAFRLLSDHGRIVIADGFLVRTDFGEREREIYDAWLNGWALPGISTRDDFLSDMKKAGFSNVQYIDKFQEIRKTRNCIHRTGIFGYPFIWFLYRFGIIEKIMYDHTVACILQKRVFADSRNLGTYGIFVAEKQL